MTIKRPQFLLLPLILLCFLMTSAAQGPARGGEIDEGEVRTPILAGSWYPGEPESLSSTIEGFLNSASVEPCTGPLKALVVPHAGYRYSGGVAAHAYKLLEGRSFKRIVLIGPSHRMRFSGASVNLQAGYRTPLGTVPVDREFGTRLIKAARCTHFRNSAHAREHSLEIQLPFLQRVLDSFEIVPILMGGQDPDTCRALAQALSECLKRGGDGTLLLASTDLSHFHNARKAEELDSLFIKHLKSFAPEELTAALASGKCEACGGGPVVTVLSAAKSLGADSVAILDYAHSGEITGDNSRVVGYTAAAVFNSSGRDPRPE